jgi:hypothetical protein
MRTPRYHPTPRYQVEGDGSGADSLDQADPTAGDRSVADPRQTCDQILENDPPGHTPARGGGSGGVGTKHEFELTRGYRHEIQYAGTLRCLSFLRLLLRPEVGR